MATLGSVVRGVLVVIGLACLALVAADLTANGNVVGLTPVEASVLPWVGLGFELAAIALAIGAVAGRLNSRGSGLDRAAKAQSWAGSAGSAGSGQLGGQIRGQVGGPVAGQPWQPGGVQAGTPTAGQSGTNRAPGQQPWRPSGGPSRT